jgi:uncharacterized protein (TIGR02246 family)
MLRRCLPALLVCMLCASAGGAEESRAEIDAFNRAFTDATRRMSNESILALWEEDGISLLPSTPPIIGKKAIAQFLTDVMSQLPGAKMESFECDCHDVEIAGSWASEWCTEHQIVRLAGDKTFDGRGKMLLVLHRGADGRWRIRREMWNQAP